MDAVTRATGRVTRVNGALVQATGLAEAGVADVVEIGEAGVTGEVVAIRGDAVTIRAYEYTGGLAPGHLVVGRGAPLTAPLGPHLLGGVFDGLLRPLRDAPRWLAPVATRAGTGGNWAFTPTAGEGRALEPGMPLGRVAVAGAIAYEVLLPPDAGGTVTALRPAGSVAGDAVVATVAGRPVRLTEPWPVRRPRPYRTRLEATLPLATGQRVLDTLFPLARGGSTAVPGGFGTGKTMLLQQIAKWCDADVIVYVGCGERGNELADVLSEFADLSDPRTGGRLAVRTIVIANTSNMPVMAREASIHAAVTVAEHFRDMGLDVVVIADSTSRWAEALREFASRGDELPVEEGYPASLASELAAFYERAGRVVALSGREGSVTIIGAVSPAGGDMTEPVTTHTQRFTRAVWALDRDLAYARHYPAVSWSGSFARDTDAIAAWHSAHGDPDWAARRARIAGLLTEADRLAGLAELIGVAALPARERIGILAGRLLREGVLQQSALSAVDAACDAARAAALADAVLSVIDRCHDLAAAGVAAESIEAADFGPIVRAREQCPGPPEVHAARDAVLDGLSDLAAAG